MTFSPEPSHSELRHPQSPDPQPSGVWTTLAHLLRPQGRKGELLAELHTDFPEHFDERTGVFLAKPGFTGPESAARPISVRSHWLPVGRNQGRIVLGFDSIDSIEAAEQLAGLDVLVPASQRVELEDDDEEYISDLVGCTVFDGEISVGSVTGVEFAMSSDGSRRLDSAAPLLTVASPDGAELLIPYVQAFVVALRMEDRRIDMQLPPGLIDLNRTGST